MIPFTRGLSLFFQFSSGRTTLHWTLSWYLRLSVALLLRFLVFSQHLFLLMSTLKAYHYSDTFMAAWQFLSMKAIPCCTFHFSNSASLQLLKGFLMHSNILQQKTVELFSGSVRLLESLVFFKHMQSTSLWPLVRFHKGFIDLHYCSGAISTRLHMSLINLIPSGNSLDTWARHCCLLTLLFGILDCLC